LLYLNDGLKWNLETLLAVCDDVPETWKLCRFEARTAQRIREGKEVGKCDLEGESNKLLFLSLLIYH
jgi:hypothetical protein